MYLEVTQELEWTGWRINTADFKIYLTEKKLLKAELKLDMLLLGAGKKIQVKDLSLVVGLIINFGSGGRANREIQHKICHDGGGQGGG